MPHSVDPLTLVIGECVTISSEMRKIPKWSQNGVAAIIGGQLYSGRDLLFGSDQNDDDAGSNGALGFKNSSARANAYNYYRNNLDNGPSSSGNSAAPNGTGPLAQHHPVNLRLKTAGESPLLSSFIQLRILLTDIKDINDIDTLTLLQPFLMVIKSSATSGYITALLLSSLSKFLDYSIISPTSKNISQSLPQIISSLTRCRFEAGDQASDDAVLLKVLRLLENTLNSDLGDLLSDDVVYEVIQTCLSLACNKRRSEVLRRAAEMAMTSITIRIFGKLKDIRPEVSLADSLLRSDHVLQADTIGTGEADGVQSGDRELKKSEQSEQSGESGESEKELLKGENDTEIDDNAEIDAAKTPLDEASASFEASTNSETPANSSPTSSTNSSSKPTPPYGIPCIKEYLSILIYMISPSNQYQHMESTRVFAFSLITTAVEVSARHLHRHPMVMSLVADSVCKNLLQTLQTVDQPSLLYAALQLFVTLTVSLSEELRLQIELILLTVFESVSPDFDKLNSDLHRNNDRLLKFDDRDIAGDDNSTARGHDQDKNNVEPASLSRSSTLNASTRSSISKEMLLETTSILWSRFPDFFVKLFINYDCDFDRQDTGVMVVKYLCRLSLPDTALASTDNVPPIALEGLLSFVNGINERAKLAMELNAEFVADHSNQLVLQKNQKQEFLECIKLLNEDDKKGLQLLNEKGFIKNLDDVDELLTFYFEKSASLNKKRLGEVLAKPSNLDLLKKFMSLFNFANLRVDEALRVLLKSFRLPGESQQIERIVETFADKYVACQNYDSEDAKEHQEDVQEEVKPDKDAVFVLSYSVIMLNTDQHSPKVKEHMTLEQYKRNLRGVYLGKDFPSWYLEKIYNSIKEREIIIPEEHHGTTKWFDEMWNNLILQHELGKANPLPKEVDYTQFDKVLFAKTSDFVISTLLSIFEEASDDHIITRMMTTIDRCASIASYFKLDDILDKLVEVLSHLTTLTGVKPSQLIVEDGSIRDVIPVTQIKVEQSKETITVSEVSVWFGRDFKAQLSTIELFRILKKNHFKISDNWLSIVTIILTLFENCLISPDIFPEFQKKLNLPAIPKVKPQFHINRNKLLKETGFLSSFSAFLKGYSDEPPEPTDEEIQSTLSTINCIKSSSLMRLFSSISNTEPANSDRFIHLLLRSLPVKSKATARFYDAEVIFIIEIAVCLSLVSMNQEIISLIITMIDELFESNKNLETVLSENNTPEPDVGSLKQEENLLKLSQQNLEIPQQKPSSSATIKVSTLVRLSTYKLLLLRNSETASEPALMQTLERLQNIDKTALLKHGFPLIKPLGALLDDGTWTKEVVRNKDQYWTLIRSFASSLKYNREIFEFIEARVETCISEENYFLILGLLDEISSAGAVGAQWEQEYEKLVKTGHKVEDKNPYEEVIKTSIESIKLTSSIRLVVDYKVLTQLLCHQCYNPCNEIRVFAIQALETALMSSLSSQDLISADSVSENCLFSLLADIMKPENVMDINILKMITKYYLKVGLDNIKSGYILKYVKIVQLMIRKLETKDFEEQAIEMLKNMYLIFKEENKEDANNAVLDQMKELIGIEEEKSGEDI